MKQLFIAMLLLAGGFVQAAEKGSTQVLELSWEDLVPKDYSPDAMIEKYEKEVADLSDSDPEAERLLKEIEEVWRNAPAVESLNGRRVKLPGYVVPLEGDGRKVSEFLLVPYLGACVHVPPPPSNQIVFINAKKTGAIVRRLFDTVWVTGTLRIERFSSEIGDAGYRIEASKVEPFE